MVLMDYDEPKPARSISVASNTSGKKLYAKAIYDNIADTTDELAFRRGDILTVIEQNTSGLEGWWLCTLRGRQGICPGNRLKLTPAHDSGCYSPSPLSSPCPSLGTISIATTPTVMTPSSDFYENTSLFSSVQQKLGKRRSWHIMPNKVVTPQKCGDVYLYDLLPRNKTLTSLYTSFSTSMSSDSDAYDTPKPAVAAATILTENYNQNQSRPYTMSRHRINDDSYDVPKSVISLLSQHNSTPSSSNSSLLTSDSFSLGSSNRSSSIINMPDYDIPRRNAPTRTPPPLTPTPSNLSVAFESNYDIPNTPTSLATPIAKLVCRKELPLELSSALDTLDRLQIEATTAVKRLLSFVTSNWRQCDKLDPVLMDLKLAAVRLRTALHDLAEFGEGCLGNASKMDDKTLLTKLKPLVKALKDSDKLVHDASHVLDTNGWTVEVLSRTEAHTSLPPDSVDQLIACAQTLTEDVRQISSFIQGNATLLFKKMTPSTPTTKVLNNTEWTKDYDYDYVSLETKEALAKKNAEIRDALPEDLQKNFESMVKNAESAAKNAECTGLDANDKSLLIYYTTQTVTHMNYLNQAIDAFLETVQRNQPPKIFLAYGKFVVLSAYNLVNIGDIVSRNVSVSDVKTKVLFCADTLTDALKQCVAKTKKAAQHFPSVTAVQEMLDSVVDISHSASDLKVAMLQTIGPVVQQ